ncbi:MAG: cysteine methyltransferase [Candidatus Latescibacteria bacterium]|nr:cysteine methyltransferase [Candidatus Latescibacterota bacterium]
MRQAFYAMVARIPYGKVATYGQIATLAGYPGRARQVGFALAGMPEEMDLPWHRVINAQGKVSPRAHSTFHVFQHVLLEQEGVEFKGTRIDLGRYRWGGDEAE